jgi:group II intron reverse transcriptase/maturase
VRVDAAELQVAWDAIHRGGKAPGPDGISARAMVERLSAVLECLARELRQGAWTHGPYRTVTVPKPNGGRRTLCIANVRDRLVQRVLLARITPALEEVSLPCSFAYRPGLSHRHALRMVQECRDRGFQYVLRADVRDCFDTIRLEIVRQLLEQLTLDDEVAQLVLESIAAAKLGNQPDVARLGLPQGAVLSPALCNLTLTELDRAVGDSHVRLVRYADDMALMALSERGLSRARERAEYALWTLGLKLNETKTYVTDFEQGFRFLGARVIGSFVVPDKGPRYPGKYPPPFPRRRRDGLGYLL